MSDKSDKGDEMSTIGIFPNNPDPQDEVVKPGDKVRVTRIVTFEYEVDVTEFLGGTDETEITLEMLKAVETDVMPVWDLKGQCEIVDDDIPEWEIVHKA